MHAIAFTSCAADPLLSNVPAIADTEFQIHY